ncbi:hypothetical protein [Furfurilactobacillus entadae]|uniref:hypothetical protein n=1 Tax=Furfurilactobacillus entadae TaxID=2922307 RepID=UPI0035EDA1A6
MTNDHYYRRLALLAGAGISAGFAIGSAIQAIHVKHPDRILAKVKASFQKTGDLDGSWIEHRPVPFKKRASDVLVYRGGVTRQENHHTVVYAFLADIYSGKVLDVWKVATPLS